MTLEQVECICNAYKAFRDAEKELGKIATMFSDATSSDFLWKAEAPLIDAVTAGMTADEQIKACEFLERDEPEKLYETIKECEKHE